MTALEPTTPGLLVRISTVSGRIEVVAEQRPDVTVDGRAVVTRTDRRITIHTISSALVVRVPVGTDVVIGTASGRIEIKGAVGAVSAVTASGRVEIERAASIDVRTASGRVEIGEIAGRCCVRTVSGRVSVGGCGDADVATKSARIELDNVHGTVHAHCISGRIEIDMSEAHDVAAESISGRITVSLPPGTVVGDTCTVSARSVSGRVEVSPR